MLKSDWKLQCIFEQIYTLTSMLGNIIRCTSHYILGMFDESPNVHVCGEVLYILKYCTNLQATQRDKLQMFITKNKVAFSFEFISKMSMSSDKHQLTQNIL